MQLFSKIVYILGGALLSDATFTCPHGTYVNPLFNLEIFHLQDASPSNTRGRIKMKDIYTGFVTDMVEANIPIKMGTAGFVDDDGFQPTENGRFCYEAVTDMEPIISYVDALERVNMVPADQSNYDRYESGFKAMTMAANRSGGVVPWSTESNTLKILVTASNAAPKVVEGSRKCPSQKSKSWNDCDRWNSERSFQSANECLDVTNQPTYDDFASIGNRDVHYINFVYYNDGERDSYFGARSLWGNVTYELSNRGFTVSLIDENRYFHLLSLLFRLVQSEACVSSYNTTTTTTTTTTSDNHTTADVENECKGRLSETCYCPKEKGYSYNGPVHNTTDGTLCIPWADASKYQDTDGDFCRNPDGSGRSPWCYTDSHGGYGYCDQIPSCGCTGFDPTVCGCDASRKSDYRGTINVTRSGKRCQNWADQTPHSHWYLPDSRQYRGSDLSENYCRNPNNEQHEPWCYVDDVSERWDYCEVPTCGQ